MFNINNFLRRFRSEIDTKYFYFIYNYILRFFETFFQNSEAISKQKKN